MCLLGRVTIQKTLFAVHVPSYAEKLPEQVCPIPTPDTKREAEMLLALLDAGLYPHLLPPKELRPPKEPEEKTKE